MNICFVNKCWYYIDRMNYVCIIYYRDRGGFFEDIR